MALETGYYELNNGQKIPRFGLGTWNSAPGAVQTAVEAAIDAGYRHIDCAHVYGNENEVGEAIAKKISEGVVKREDLFITSKLWNTYHRPEHVEENLKKTLSDLKLDYIDLYLIHWPVAFKLNEKREHFPHANPETLDFDNEAHYVETFAKMLEIQKSSGAMRSLGVSNFCVEQLENLKARGMVPQVNQVESHPFNAVTKLNDYCQANKIIITAYSPLGSPGRPAGLQNGQAVLMDHQVPQNLAKKYNKSVAQILIRFAIDRGFVVIPKSVTPSRIVDNSKVFDFSLTKEEVDSLIALDGNVQYVYPARFVGSKFFPWPAGGYKE